MDPNQDLNEEGGRNNFPGKRGAVKLYFLLYPDGTSGECALWIRHHYGVKIRSKRVSTIRKQFNPGVSVPRSKTMSQKPNQPSQPFSSIQSPPVRTADSAMTTPQTPEVNGEEKTVGHRLTHITFFKVCEVLKEYKDKFLEHRPNAAVTAEWLTELSKIPVSAATVKELKEATGITWEAKIPPPRPKSAKAHKDRTIVTSIIRLHREMGISVPRVLIELYEEITNRKLVNVKVDETPEDKET